MTEESIFAAALDRADPAERAAYLQQACAGDPELLRNVEELLRSHEQAGRFLETPAVAPGTDDEPQGRWFDRDAPAPPAEGPGMVVGPYRLLQKLGEGGMGAVWMAEQHEPVQRRVAVKVIKAGMDSAHVLARFEQERQALALMDHPNIARVLDAGETPPAYAGGSPRPYFVMELVKGVPFTQYCDRERLSLRERLELFMPVCQAVQHAHQKGVIHRDLKPSNVLVALYDGKPIPKVIDFGVAKATAQKLTERTLFTEVGQIVGTLEYMAPEQAELNNLDVDTRADVYALGAILYELLTGGPPFAARQLRGAAFTEMLRIIREVEPARPSVKLAGSGDLAAIAAQRRLEPRKLTRLVQGDLDWIAMKCLEKERGRRYETANGLALDVQRHLADEPVQAGPPSAAYRLGKFLRRNRGPVLAAGAVLLALVGGVIGTTVGLVQAQKAHQAEREQRRLVEGERDEKEKARQAANASALQAQANERSAINARVLAQKRLAQVKKANDILGWIFVDLDPRHGEKEGLPLSVQLARRLDRASEMLEGAEIGDPVMTAYLQETLGASQAHLGFPKRGLVLLTQARTTLEDRLGADHPDTLNCMNYLAEAYMLNGELEKATPLFEETLAKRRKRLGPDDPETLVSMNNLANAYEHAEQPEKALPLHEEVLAKRKARFGPDDPATLESMHNLSSTYLAMGQMAKAVPLLEEALAKARAQLAPDAVLTLACMNSLASAYGDLGQPKKALPLAEEVLPTLKTKLGPDHPYTLSALNTLGKVYWQLGRLDKALPLLEESLARRKANSGADHPLTLTAMNNLGEVYREVGRLDQAVPLMEEGLARSRAKLGPDHSETLNALNNLAVAYRDAGEPKKAFPLQEEAVERLQRKMGPDHPLTLSALNNLATGYWQDRQLDRSIPLFEKTLELRKAKLGPNHRLTLTTQANLGINYRDARRLDEAAALLEDALERARKHPDSVPASSVAWIPPELVETYERAGQFPRAEPWRRDFLEQARKQFGADDLRTAGQTALLGHNLLRQKKYADAEPLLRDCLKVREAKQKEAWTTFGTRSMLGDALLGQQKYAEAEPLLLEGYEGMKEREKSIPPQGKARLTEALERLVQLYDAWGKKDRADEWRAKLEAAGAKEKP
jgi:serine/threonine protein kinase